MESKAAKRARYGLMRTGVDDPTSPFKEEVTGSTLRATRSRLASGGKALELTGDSIERLDAAFRAAQDQRTLHRR